MSPSIQSALFKTAFWLACATVVVLSLLPVAELPPISLDVWDKAQHATGFAVLGLLALQAYPNRLATCAIGLLVFGAAIELAQSASGWRTGDPLDWVADAVGLACALLSSKLKPRAPT